MKKIRNSKILYFVLIYLLLFSILIGQVVYLSFYQKKLQQTKEQLLKSTSLIEKDEMSYEEEKKKLYLALQLVNNLQQTVLQLEQEKKDIIEKRIETLSEAKDVYLTFDDGPSSLTEKNLDLLKKYNIKATFFVIHSNEKYHYLLKRMVSEGHTIGLHSYSHEYKDIYKSVDAYFEDINKLQQEVKNVTGVETHIIRFPGGSSNTISRYSPGIMSKLTKETLSRGYRYYDWNISSGDGGNVGLTQFIKNSTNSRDKKSIMLLMHDSISKTSTSKGLEQVIQYYLKEGYEFKPITMDSSMFAHRVKN